MDRDEIHISLIVKLDNAWEKYLQRMAGSPSWLVLNHAREVVATEQVYSELHNGAYSTDLLEYLLRFEDPLEVARDQWMSESDHDISEDMTHALWCLMDRREAEQHYDLDPEFMPQDKEISEQQQTPAHPQSFQQQSM